MIQPDRRSKKGMSKVHRWCLTEVYEIFPLQTLLWLI